MDNLIKFPSLTNPDETGYTVYANGSELSELVRRGGNPLAAWCAAWPTYGDGMVQHGPDYPVQGEALGDFCASLATYLMANPDAVELVARNWPKEANPEDVRFYRSVRYKEEKKRYFSPRERKQSGAEAKRHDKRWFEVLPWMDGSVKAVVGMFYTHGWVEGGLIYRVAMWRDVKAALDAQEGPDASPYCNLTSEKDLMGEDRDANWIALQAFDAVDELVRAWRSRECAERALAFWRSNSENRAKRKAEQAKAAETKSETESSASGAA